MMVANLKKYVLAVMLFSWLAVMTPHDALSLTCDTMQQLRSVTGLSVKDTKIIEDCIHIGYDPPINWRPNAGQGMGAGGRWGGSITPVYKCPPDAACPSSDRDQKGNRSADGIDEAIKLPGIGNGSGDETGGSKGTCPAGYIVKNGKCVRGEGNENGDSDEVGECPKGYSGKNGECVENPKDGGGGIGTGVCPNDYISVGGKCTKIDHNNPGVAECPPGYKSVEDICVPSSGSGTSTGQCPVGYKSENGKCTKIDTTNPGTGQCPKGYKSENGKCTQTDTSVDTGKCPTGFISRNGKCVKMDSVDPGLGECPAGYSAKQGQCMPVDDDSQPGTGQCPPDFISQNGKCIRKDTADPGTGECPVGHKAENGQCVASPEIGQCPTGFIVQNGVCTAIAAIDPGIGVCPNDFTSIQGKCVPVDGSPEAPGVGECPKDHIAQEGKCVPIESADPGKGECPSGYKAVNGECKKTGSGGDTCQKAKCGDVPSDFPTDFAAIFPDDDAPPSDSVCPVSGNNLGNCGMDMKSHCMRNKNPPSCFVSGNADNYPQCAPNGYLTDAKDKNKLEYRDYGYSNDYVADYLVGANIITKSMTSGKPYREFKERIPKRWFSKTDPKVAFLKPLVFDPTMKNPPIQDGTTVAVMVTCRYYRGQAGIVTHYDAANKCAYVKSRNWLTYQCDALSRGNCFQNNGPLPKDNQPFMNFKDMAPREWDNCIGVKSISYMFNMPAQAPSLPEDQVVLNRHVAACHKAGKGSMDRDSTNTDCKWLCDNGYETYCGKPE